MPGQPIIELCRDPRDTRDQARRGLPTPCHRCLAYRPEQPIACILLNAKREEHKPQPKADQTSIWRKPND